MRLKHYLVGQHERKLIMYLLDMCMSYSISLQPIMAPERPYVLPKLPHRLPHILPHRLPHNYTISFIIITYNYCRKANCY